MPEGAGVQVVTDANGNLLRSNQMPPGDGRDSLTYTILSSFGPHIQLGTYPLEAFTVSATREDFIGSGLNTVFSKKWDINSVGFVLLAATQPTNTMIIEVKVYESGESTPYCSYKLKNITVLSFGNGAAFGGEGQLENYVISGQVFGIKNLETGLSFAFNSVTDMEVAY
jgi:hypothetical protein